MRKFYNTMGVWLLLASCQAESPKTEGSKAISSGQDALEVYQNDSTRFLVFVNNTFTLATKGKEGEVRGNLNYERGLGDDIDATVYVLNFDKAGSEQYYVRYTKNDSTLVPLNQARKETGRPYLVKVEK